MANELKSYVKDYMTKNVITVKPETPNTDVIQIMKKTKHDGFPVIDDTGEIVVLDLFQVDFAEVLQDFDLKY